MNKLEEYKIAYLADVDGYKLLNKLIDLGYVYISEFTKSKILSKTPGFLFLYNNASVIYEYTYKAKHFKKHKNKRIFLKDFMKLKKEN